MRSQSIAYYYILTLVILGLLPLVLFIHLPQLRLITRITPPSSYNFDTSKNNQFTISGKVSGQSPNIFIDLYQKNLYQVGSLTFAKFRYVKTISADGLFAAEGMDGGDYLVVPKSRPWQRMFFSKKYFVQLKDHDPAPLIIDPPVSSVFQFAIDSIRNSSYYKR